MGTRQTNKKPANRSRERRRSYLINPAFQWKYAVWIVLGVFLVSSLMTVVLFGVLHEQARARVLEPVGTNAWENTLTIVLFAGAFAAMMATVFGFWSIFITHRIGGPMFVMKRHLAQLAEGRFPDRRPLRKKDEFKELYDALWDAIDVLKARKQSDLAALTQALRLAQSAADADDKSRRCALDALTAHIDTLRRQAADVLGMEADDVPAPRATDRKVSDATVTCA